MDKVPHGPDGELGVDRSKIWRNHDLQNEVGRAHRRGSVLNHRSQTGGTKVPSTTDFVLDGKAMMASRLLKFRDGRLR